MTSDDIRRLLAMGVTYSEILCAMSVDGPWSESL
jgi:hypothetical protein